MPNYSVKNFIADAKAAMQTGLSLEDKQAIIADHLIQLSKRSDLTRFAVPLGPVDAANNLYLLWMEPPSTVLFLAQFDPAYQSPIHEHRDYWIVAAGYRGIDRWDLYQRTDDGSIPGRADVVLVDQRDVRPGSAVWMPPPPRSIHSHNNPTTELSMELQFSAATPPRPEDRLIYNLDDGTCAPSWWKVGDLYKGDRYPPVMERRNPMSAMQRISKLFCPICELWSRQGAIRFQCS